MPFYKRGFLYLARKRAKSILLLLIFLFVNSMILSTNMILHATERTEAAMQEKAGAKVVCEMSRPRQHRHLKRKNSILFLVFLDFPHFFIHSGWQDTLF